MALVAIGVTVVGSLASAPPALAADDASSTVIAGAQPLGDRAYYPDLAAGGNGVYHAVYRDDSLGTRIIYARSTDSGRTWVRGAMLGGTIAGTRPHIAADGQHVAAAFIGEWTDSNGVTNEAPYLTTSDDGGSSWTPARRLGNWASDVDVAVDGDRVWVIWGGNGGIRGTTDGGATFFVSQALPGVLRASVEAGGGLVSAAYLNGAGDTVFAVGQDESLGAWHTANHAVLQDVGAADGKAYVLVADGADLSVLATEPGGSPSRAHIPAPYGGSLGGGAFTNLWADLAAGRGSVAVATCQADTVYVSESTTWPTFTEPVAATTFDGGQPCKVSISAAVGGTEIQPRFDWTVAPHYSDSDGDGLPEPANASGTSADNVIIGDNGVLEVTLDGCASLAAGGGTPITHWIWSVEGVQIADLDECVGPTIEVPSGASRAIRLEVRDDDGGRAIATHTITPKDVVVVSLGDGLASGEGSPLKPQTSTSEVSWTDRSCHRSPYAGAAQAAEQLENEDPHSAVTFIQLACSGAAIADTFASGATTGTGTSDDPVTGGVTDAYAGIERAATCATSAPCPTLRPSQLTQLTQLLGNRQADAVLVSAGAEDLRLSGIYSTCREVAAFDCNTGATASDAAAREAGLFGRFQQLAAGLTAAGIAANTVHITEYPDPTGDRYGVAEMRCYGAGETVPLAATNQLGFVKDGEAGWLRGTVLSGLNAGVRSAATANHWNVVGGFAPTFATHGYCSDTPWVTKLGESYAAQDDALGTFSLNSAGQEQYADALHAAIAPLTRTAVTPVGETPATGAASVGDLLVLAANVWDASPELRAVALTTTGGAPTVGAVRRLQSVAGWGAAATDGTSSAAVWSGFDGGWAAQIGSRPNAAVRDVQLVQGAADASRLVTNRKTSVLATIWSAAETTTTLKVTTTVVARKDGTDTSVVPATTEDVLLKPGENRVLLPAAESFDAPEDSVLIATVKVQDPTGASEEDSADNELSSSPADFVPTMETRPLKIAFLPLDFAGDTVSCSTIAGKANSWVAWAQQVLPVPDGGVQADLSCLPEVLVEHADEEGVAQALGELDLLAREAGLDAVVGVAPDGWLGDTLGDGSVGRAAVTGRSIIIDETAPDTTLGHELAHTLGEDHREAVPAVGAWVSRNRVIEGRDFMTTTQDGTSRYWVSGATWDDLTAPLNPGSAPARPESPGEVYWIRGSMPIGGDTLSLEPFIEDGDIPSPPPSEEDEGSITVVPVAADGSPTSDPVYLGAFADVSLDGDGSGPLRFAQKVRAPAGTAAFRVYLDGTLVEERQLGSAPAVTVTAPTSGTVVARSQKIHVAWTAADPDGDDLRIDLLVSDDDGANWRPFASNVSGTSADLSVPQDLGGEHIKIRVVATDGMHMRWADSETFSIGTVAAGATDRLVFVAVPTEDRVPAVLPTRIGTINPDGTDLQWLSLPTEVDGGGVQLKAQYDSPVWGPNDERIYFVSSEASDDGRGCIAVRSVKADGTDLKKEFAPQGEECWNFSSSYTHCLSLSEDAGRMLVDNFVYERRSGGWVRIGSVSLTGAGGAATGVQWQGILPFASNIAVQPYGNQCPTLSPDGTKVAGVAAYHGWRYADDDQPGGPGSELAVAVAPATTDSDESNITFPRIVSVWDEALWRPDGTPGTDTRQLTVSWTSDGALLVARGTPSWTGASIERLDVAAVPAGFPLVPAVATPLATATLPASASDHRAVKQGADGTPYGDITCGYYEGSGTATVHQSAAIVSADYCITDVDWGQPQSNTPHARVAFVAGDPDLNDNLLGSDPTFRYPSWPRIGTMSPDGSDVDFLPLPETVTLYGSTRPAIYSSPVWGPDNRIYFGVQDDRGDGSSRRIGLFVDSVKEDGSDRRAEISPPDNPFVAAATNLAIGNSQEQCLSMSADGTRMLVNYVLFQHSDAGWASVGTVPGVQVSNGSLSGSAYAGLWPFMTGSEANPSSSQCPMLSPDGKYVARVIDVHGHLDPDLGTDGSFGAELGVIVTPVTVNGATDTTWISSSRLVTAWDAALYRRDDAAGTDSRALGISWLSGHELLVTRGTPGWDSATKEKLDISTLVPDDPSSPTGTNLDPAATTTIGTVSLPTTSAVFRDPKVAPDGVIYGDLDCGLYYGKGSIATFHSAYVAGTPTCYRDFSWNGVALNSSGGDTGGGATDIPAIVIEPADAPDPEDLPIPEPVVVDEGPAAPGAGDDAAPPVVSDITPHLIVLAPGQTREVALGNDANAPVRYEIDPLVDQPSGGGTVRVIGDVDPVSGHIITDMTLTLVADAETINATGAAHVRVRVVGTDAWQVIDLQFAVPSRPAAKDDTLDAEAGVETTFPVDALLGNDAPTVPFTELRLVVLGAYDQGEAFVGQDGLIHVAPDAAGTGTFTYLVAQGESTGVSAATVTVNAVGNSTPTDPTTPTVPNEPPTGTPGGTAHDPAARGGTATEPPTSKPPTTATPSPAPSANVTPKPTATSAPSAEPSPPTTGAEPPSPPTAGVNWLAVSAALALVTTGLWLVFAWRRRRRGGAE